MPDLVARANSFRDYTDFLDCFRQFGSRVTRAGIARASYGKSGTVRSNSKTNLRPILSVEPWFSADKWRLVPFSSKGKENCRRLTYWYIEVLRRSKTWILLKPLRCNYYPMHVLCPKCIPDVALRKFVGECATTWHRAQSVARRYGGEAMRCYSKQ